MKRTLTTIFTLLLTLTFAAPARAQGQRFNAVQTDSGLTFSASSEVGPTYPLSSAFNSDTSGLFWSQGQTNGAGFNSGHSDRHGVVQINLTFGKNYAVEEIVLYGLTNQAADTGGATAPEPNDTTTSAYANKSYVLETSENGVDWRNAGSVSNNSLVINRFKYGPPLAPLPLRMRYLRIKCDAANNSGGFCRQVEVQVWARQQNP